MFLMLEIWAAKVRDKRKRAGREGGKLSDQLRIDFLPIPDQMGNMAAVYHKKCGMMWVYTSYITTANSLNTITLTDNTLMFKVK